MNHALDCIEARSELVKRYISPVVQDGRISSAFLHVPRELFVPANMRDRAYEDVALPIGHGQTVSQPSLVALMTEALELDPSHIVLEIGTGSGYQAAILSRLVWQVFTIERIRELAIQARAVLRRLGYKNVQVIQGDGKRGCKTHAPYDAIVVTAGATTLPDTLVDQLREGGHIVAPLGSNLADLVLRAGVKTSGHIIWRDLCPVAFVPLV